MIVKYLSNLPYKHDLVKLKSHIFSSFATSNFIIAHSKKNIGFLPFFYSFQNTKLAK